MIEYIMIGLTAGVVFTFFVIGIVCSFIIIYGFFNFISIPLSIISKYINKLKIDKQWSQDPIFSRFKR